MYCIENTRESMCEEMTEKLGFLMHKGFVDVLTRQSRCVDYPNVWDWDWLAIYLGINKSQFFYDPNSLSRMDVSILSQHFVDTVMFSMHL